MGSIFNNAPHWLKRAADAYRVADQLDDPLAKNAMLAIASSYKELAILSDVKTPFEVAGSPVEKRRS